jgi:transposase InsO family protein
MHPGARTTPCSRALIVRRHAAGESVTAIAHAFGVSRQTVYKWLRRWRECGDPGLLDRRPIAKHFPQKLPFAVERSIERLRRVDKLLGWQISRALGVPRSTVIKVLKRLRLARLSDLVLPELVQRYEYREAGELVHIDIKKLGKFRRIGHRIHGDNAVRSRGSGWEHVYVCIDDATRAAFAQIRPAENREEATAFLIDAIAAFKDAGISVQRVMTDNGKVFGAKSFRAVEQELGIRHLWTRPFRPCTNGKAERFIKTMLREWAYGVAFENSEDRRAAFIAWLDYNNQERPHSALKLQPPASRLRLCQRPA